MIEDTMLSRALHYASEGWRVFPVGQDKAPLIKDNLNQASNDEAIVRSFWEAHPKAAIGGVTDGPFWVIDIDTYQGGEYGKEEIEAVSGPLPATRVNSTPSGGEHWYYRAPNGRMPRRMIGYLPGIDILGIGGFVILEGAVRNKQTGALGVYEVREDFPIADADPREFGVYSNNAGGVIFTLPEVHNPLAYAAKALERSCDAMKHAPEGERNQTLNKLAFRLFCCAKAGWIEATEVEDSLGDAGLEAGLDAEETGKTLASARSAAQERQLEGKTLETRQVLLPSSEPLRIAEALTAEKHVCQYGGRFWVYDVDHYRSLDLKSLRHIARTFHDRVFCLNDKGEYIKRGANISRVRELIEALESTAPEKTPADGMVSTESGLVDMWTGKLKSHTPDIFCPTHVNCPWTGDVDDRGDWASLVATSLEEDVDRMQLLAEWMGYVISGRTHLQKFLFLYGVTASGKSVIMNVLRALVGHENTASVTPCEFASDKTSLLEPLIGKTLITGDDSRDSMSWGHPRVVSRILSISAGDSIQIDRKYQIPFHGALPGRMMFMSNASPRFDDNAGAIRRRCLVLPFRKSFADNPDTGIEHRILRDDMASVLAFAQMGYRSAAGKNEIIQIETPEETAFSETQISSFADEELVFADGVKVEYYEMYGRYENWCKRNGEQPESLRKFNRELKTRYPQVRKWKSNGSYYHLGVGLL